MRQKTAIRKSDATPITAALPTNIANTLRLQISNAANTPPTDVNLLKLRQSLHKYNNSCDPSPVCGTAHTGQLHPHYKPSPELYWLSRDTASITRTAANPTTPLQYPNFLQMSRHCDNPKNWCRSKDNAASREQSHVRKNNNTQKRRNSNNCCTAHKYCEHTAAANHEHCFNTIN